MADLMLCIQWRGLGCRCRTMKLCGVVVDCSDCGDGRFEVSVLFFSADEASADPFQHLPN